MTKQTSFDWDKAKNQENIEKHGVSFYLAQHAFTDLNRVILEDLKHSTAEKRYYCIGRVTEGILTVRFTYRKTSLEYLEPAFGERERKSMNNKTKYTDEPMDDVKIIEDFLPSPQELALKEETVKITIALSKRSVDFFKDQASNYKTQYQKLIRRLLDEYVNRQGLR